MNPPRIVGLRHLALRCQDVRAMERFYCEILGFRVTWRPGDQDVYLTSNGDNLALHLRTSGAAESPEASRLDHLGLLLARPEDVDDWAEFLRSQQITIESGPRTHRDGSCSLYLRDPEGNRVQLIYIPGAV